MMWAILRRKVASVNYAAAARSLARGTKLDAILKMLKEVLLTTPTTPRERMKSIAEATEGFLYLLSSGGVIGARDFGSGSVQSLLPEIKEETSKPVAVGFGISKPEHVKQKKVGSTSFSEGPPKKLPEIESFMETLPVSAYCVRF